MKAIADGLSVNHETRPQWTQAADESDSLIGKSSVLSIDDRAELQRLRRADRDWQLEREILPRAHNTLLGNEYPPLGPQLVTPQRVWSAAAVSGPGVPGWADYKLMARMDSGTACAAERRHPERSR